MNSSRQQTRERDLLEQAGKQRERQGLSWRKLGATVYLSSILKGTAGQSLFGGFGLPAAAAAVNSQPRCLKPSASEQREKQEQDITAPTWPPCHKLLLPGGLMLEAPEVPAQGITTCICAACTRVASFPAEGCLDLAGYCPRRCRACSTESVFLKLPGT